LLTTPFDISRDKRIIQIITFFKKTTLQSIGIELAPTTPQDDGINSDIFLAICILVVTVYIILKGTIREIFRGSFWPLCKSRHKQEPRLFFYILGPPFT
jgi:hypothetical protein